MKKQGKNGPDILWFPDIDRQETPDHEPVKGVEDSGRGIAWILDKKARYKSEIATPGVRKDAVPPCEHFIGRALTEYCRGSVHPSHSVT